MQKPVFGQVNCASVRVSSHDSPLDRVNGKAEPGHFKGITLLPTCPASDVMYLSLVVGVAQKPSAVVQCFEIEEEMLSRGEMMNRYGLP